MIHHHDSLFSERRRKRIKAYIKYQDKWHSESVITKWMGQEGRAEL